MAYDVDEGSAEPGAFSFQVLSYAAWAVGGFCLVTILTGAGAVWQAQTGADAAETAGASAPVVQSASAPTSKSLCAQDMTLGSVSLMSALGERLGVTASQAPSRVDTADLCGSPVSLRDQQW
jgi:hypothetical protein